MARDNVSTRDKVNSNAAHVAVGKECDIRGLQRAASELGLKIDEDSDKLPDLESSCHPSYCQHAGWVFPCCDTGHHPWQHA